ncbi:MAG: ATP-binding protein [Desulfobacteraceae bacterium IS3]|nr:MAG: ATP-binding protein [Desulfobacteraceae bacterium IS3]
MNFIANELLENAIKFNYYPSGFSMSISLYMSHEALRFYVTNSIAQDNLLIFQNVIHELLAENPQELYIRRLERNADEESGKDSGLGFLTMLNDYNARLAWRFETVQTRPEVTLVTTMVQLPIVRA